MTEIQKWFSELQRIINEPYPVSCADPTGCMQSDKLETHLLATPRRKTILLIDRSGDFEYDEEMTVLFTFRKSKTGATAIFSTQS